MKPEVSGDNYAKQQSITSEIDKLLKKIASDTGHCATHREKHEHPNMAKLVEMGDKIIPYLFSKLTHNGGSWTIFILLQKITKQTPVPPEHQGKFIHSMIAWMQWYIDSAYYPSDIYFGLVD